MASTPKNCQKKFFINFMSDENEFVIRKVAAAEAAKKIMEIFNQGRKLLSYQNLTELRKKITFFLQLLLLLFTLVELSYVE